MKFLLFTTIAAREGHPLLQAANSSGSKPRDYSLGVSRSLLAVRSRDGRRPRLTSTWRS